MCHSFPGEPCHKLFLVPLLPTPLKASRTTATPVSPPRSSSPTRELTVRAIILGGLITLVFTAANVYLGLKVGLTFATSIPAAVISMAVLRRFAGHTITENNIVQTVASAAGTLSAIIFVLPGLVMIGWWSGFPYWITTAVCLFGGVLGVMYSIPLRRALVTGSDLPFPEGVAAAEVLRVGDDQGSHEENQQGLRVILLGSLAAAGFSLLAALKAVAGSVSTVFRVGSGGTMLGASLSLALIGVGHLVGVTVGIACGSASSSPSSSCCRGSPPGSSRPPATSPTSSPRRSPPRCVSSEPARWPWPPCGRC